MKTFTIVALGLAQFATAEAMFEPSLVSIDYLETNLMDPHFYTEEDDSFSDCIEQAPLDDNNKNQAALLECAKEAGYDDKNSCALKCTLEAIGVYWAAAARCIKKQAPNQCITVECPAIVAAFDIPCLKSCKNTPEI